MPGDDCGGAVKLFGEHRAHQHMRPSRQPETEQQISGVARRRFMAVGGADQKPRLAHATVAPYWSRRLGKDVLRAEQASPRGGVFRCTMRGADRVALAGRCAFYLRGEITV